MLTKVQSNGGFIATAMIVAALLVSGCQTSGSSGSQTAAVPATPATCPDFAGSRTMTSDKWIPDFKVEITCNGESPVAKVTPLPGNEYTVNNTSTRASLGGDGLKFAFVADRRGESRLLAVEVGRDGSGTMQVPGHNNPSNLYPVGVRIQ